MARIEARQRIARTPQVVHACLAAVERRPGWDPNVLAARKERVDGGVRVLATIVSSAGPLAWETFFSEPAGPLRIVGEGVLPVRHRLRIELEADGAETIVTHTLDMEFDGLARLVSGLAAQRVQAQLQASLDGLREHLEATAPLAPRLPGA